MNARPRKGWKRGLEYVVIHAAIFIEDFLCVRRVLGPGIAQNRKYAPRAMEQILQWKRKALDGLQFR